MKKILLAGLALSLSMVTKAQTLSLDQSFGTNGYTLSAVPGDFTQFYAIKKTSNEAFICLGSEEDNNGSTKGFLAKYTNSGSLDNSFGTNGIVKFNDAASIENHYLALELQSDGKILVGGTNYDDALGESRYLVRRYHANGTPDNTFGSNGSAEISVNTMGYYGDVDNISIQTDGKILLSYETEAGAPGIARLNADGTLDITFGLNGLANPGIGIPGIFYNYVKALDNGKILVAAYVLDVNAGFINELIVYGLNSNGMADLAFGVNGKFNYFLPGQAVEIQNINLQSDGKIIIGGTIYDPNSAAADISLMLIRLNTNGSPDNSFGTQGVATITPEPGDIEVTSVHVLNDDKVIINYGNYDSVYSGLVRFTANGTADVTFNNNSAIKIVKDFEQGSYIGSIEIQNDQKIVFAGAAVTDISEPEYTTVIGRMDYSGTGIKTTFKDMANIYPNPAKDKLYINLSNPEATATVFDLSGKKVLEQSIYRNGILSLDRLNSGTYLLHLRSGSASAAQQFTIIK